MGLLDPEIKPTKRQNGLLGLLADAISAADNFARKPFGFDNPPAQMISGLLGVPSIAKTLDDMSYGAPLTTGSGWATQMKPHVADTALAVMPNPRLAAGLLSHGMGGSAVDKAATVWHGSPHKFDRFDSSKIGTGEGAQAYGHGLYLAESKDVADAYKRSNMFGVQNAFKNTGGELPQIDEVAFMGRQLGGLGGAALRSGGAADPGMSAGLRRFPSGGSESSIADLGYGATPAKLRALAPDMSQPERDALQWLIQVNGDGAKASEILAAKGKADAARIARESANTFKVLGMTPGSGNLYKVDLPDPVIARMLNWDAPLSQQAPSVRKSLNELGLGGSSAWDEINGLNLFFQVGQRSGAKDISKAASGILQGKGIPGIRYLDGGSRGAGAGTSNFVVFPGEENILTILERNGIPLR